MKIVATSHTPEFTTVASYQREYDDAAPDAAESDVSSKESDAMSETSSQKFIQTAKKMAERELEHDATDLSDRPMMNTHILRHERIAIMRKQNGLDEGGRRLI